jgi:hypothetical protein
MGKGASNTLEQVVTEGDVSRYDGIVTVTDDKERIADDVIEKEQQSAEPAFLMDAEGEEEDEGSVKKVPDRVAKNRMATRGEDCRNARKHARRYGGMPGLHDQLLGVIDALRRLPGRPGTRRSLMDPGIDRFHCGSGPVPVVVGLHGT